MLLLDKLQPTDIAKSIKPEFNSLVFFEVSDRSFHQVAEVFSQSKSRLSINGWFHGKINKRPEPFVDPVPQPLKCKDIDVIVLDFIKNNENFSSLIIIIIFLWTSKPNIFFDWIVEKYLKPENQTGIQLKFMSSSEIKLDQVFHVRFILIL